MSRGTAAKQINTSRFPFHSEYPARPLWHSRIFWVSPWPFARPDGRARQGRNERNAKPVVNVPRMETIFAPLLNAVPNVATQLRRGRVPVKYQILSLTK